MAHLYMSAATRTLGSMASDDLAPAARARSRRLRAPEKKTVRDNDRRGFRRASGRSGRAQGSRTRLAFCVGGRIELSGTAPGRQLHPTPTSQRNVESRGCAAGVHVREDAREADGAVGKSARRRTAAEWWVPAG